MSNKVEPKKRITTRFTTKAERAKIIGERIVQLEDGDSPANGVDVTGLTSPLEIAEKEFAAGKCPVTINRPISFLDEISEKVPLSDLIVKF